jgi:hypothetical protein
MRWCYGPLEKEPERRYQTAGEFRTVVQTMAKPSKEPPPSAGDEQARPREAHGVPTGSGTPRIGGMKIKGYGDYNTMGTGYHNNRNRVFSADAGLRGVFFRTGPMDAAHYWHSGIGHLRRVLCGVLAVSFTHFSGSRTSVRGIPTAAGRSQIPEPGKQGSMDRGDATDNEPSHRDWRDWVRVVGLREGRRVINWPAVVVDVALISLIWMGGIVFMGSLGEFLPMPRLGMQEWTLVLAPLVLCLAVTVALSFYWGLKVLPKEQLRPLAPFSLRDAPVFVFLLFYVVFMVVLLATGWAVAGEGGVPFWIGWDIRMDGWVGVFIWVLSVCFRWLLPCCLKGSRVWFTCSLPD